MLGSRMYFKARKPDTYTSYIKTYIKQVKLSFNLPSV